MDQTEICTVGVAMGDAAGIGSEIVAKAAADGVLTDKVRTVVVGDRRQFERGAEIAGVSCGYSIADSIEEALSEDGLILLDTRKLDAFSVEMGKEDVGCGKDAGENIRTCVDYCRRGFFDAVSFAPNNKTALKKAGFQLHGAIDLLAGFFDCHDYCGELGVLGRIWTARVTSHIPLRDVGPALTVEKIVKAVELLERTMRAAGFDRPRIAVAGFNPHNGEGATCGREEVDVILPAVSVCRGKGWEITGPLPADTLFYRLFRGDFDGAVSMYHDQGQIAMKLKGFEKGVTVMAGLPKPVTTCSHGSAFDIAGKGIAQSGAWEHAFLMAKQMATAAKKSGGGSV